MEDQTVERERERCIHIYIYIYVYSYLPTLNFNMVKDTHNPW